MSSETLQLSALSCIQSILSPYAAQINADWNTQPFVCYNEKSLESIGNLFGFGSSTNDVALQFGDLFESLDRLSRHSTNPRLPLETARLCSMIATVSSTPFLALVTFLISQNSPLFSYFRSTHAFTVH